MTDEQMNEELEQEESAEVQEESLQEEEPQEEEEWQPDYKFKVLDKEHEFDEFIRPVVNQENYDKIRDLYEKAYGLDHVKQKKSALEKDVERYQEVESQYQKQNETLGYMGTLLKNKDYHTLFSQLKIPEQDVMKYALDRVSYNDLSAEEKQEYDRNIESRQRLANLELQNKQFQQQLATQSVQARADELNRHLASETMQSLVEEFDSRAGRPGAFRDEVIKRGQLAYYTTGKDIPVYEAAQEVVNLFGGATQTATSNANAQATKVQQSHVGPKKPTIPNVKSGGHSPARKLPRSIDDLKKAAEAFNE